MAMMCGLLDEPHTAEGLRLWIAGATNKRVRIHPRSLHTQLQRLVDLGLVQTSLLEQDGQEGHKTKYRWSLTLDGEILVRDLIKIMGME